MVTPPVTYVRCTLPEELAQAIAASSYKPYFQRDARDPSILVCTGLPAARYSGITVDIEVLDNSNLAAVWGVPPAPAPSLAAPAVGPSNPARHLGPASRAAAAIADDKTASRKGSDAELDEVEAEPALVGSSSPMEGVEMEGMGSAAAVPPPASSSSRAMAKGKNRATEEDPLRIEDGEEEEEVKPIVILDDKIEAPRKTSKARRGGAAGRGRGSKRKGERIAAAESDSSLLTDVEDGERDSIMVLPHVRRASANAAPAGGEGVRANGSTGSEALPTPYRLDLEPPEDFLQILKPHVYLHGIEFVREYDRICRNVSVSGSKSAIKDRARFDLGAKWKKYVGKARSYAYRQDLAWPPVAKSEGMTATPAKRGPDGSDSIRKKSKGNNGEVIASPSKTAPQAGAPARYTSPIKSRRVKPTINYNQDDPEVDSFLSGAPVPLTQQSDSSGSNNAQAGPSNASPGIRRKSRRIDSDDEDEEFVEFVAERGGPQGFSTPVKVKRPVAENRAKAITSIALKKMLEGKTEEQQILKCHNKRYAAYQKCTACLGKVSGDVCRFIGFRVFPIDPETGAITGPPHWNDKQDITNEALQFPLSFNQPLDDLHKYRTECCAAEALLPVFTKEWLHATLNDARHKVMGLEARATCDFCATCIFGGSWFCTSCGREYCLDCEKYFEHVAPPESLTAENPGSEAPGEIGVNQDGLDKETQIRLLRCWGIHKTPTGEVSKARSHTRDDLIPVSRWTRDQLFQEWLNLVKFGRSARFKTLDGIVDAVPFDSAKLANHGELLVRASEGVQVGTLPGAGQEEARKERVVEAGRDLEQYRSDTTAVGEIAQPIDLASLQTHRFFRFRDKAVSDDVFDAMWAKGVPIVVDDLLPRFKLDWTPTAFVERAAVETCMIVDCESPVERAVYALEFFEMFKQSPDQRPDSRVWKLKDWPSTADFKVQFPDLFKDFSEALPFPDYTRRDGVFNVTSHFPLNTICPDIGPKMYNAFAGRDAKGGHGSTRLHMDMADAVNVLMFANPQADGSAGCARWDIFRPEDADTIRDFLTAKFKDKEAFADPIHSQLFYLDAALRQELLEKTGVYSYRIFQYPGQAVFIPAGCAHQVCNLSDCIKIACDFVSPHNVERCSKLTKEFRSENLFKMRAWKDDVLQLKNTMWYAWNSCQQHEARVEAAKLAEAKRLENPDPAPESAQRRPRSVRKRTATASEVISAAETGHAEAESSEMVQEVAVAGEPAEDLEAPPYSPALPSPAQPAEPGPASEAADTKEAKEAVEVDAMDVDKGPEDPATSQSSAVAGPAPEPAASNLPARNGDGPVPHGLGMDTLSSKKDIALDQRVGYRASTSGRATSPPGRYHQPAPLQAPDSHSWGGGVKVEQDEIKPVPHRVLMEQQARPRLDISAGTMVDSRGPHAHIPNTSQWSGMSNGYYQPAPSPVYSSSHGSSTGPGIIGYAPADAYRSVSIAHGHPDPRRRSSGGSGSYSGSVPSAGGYGHGSGGAPLQRVLSGGDGGGSYMNGPRFSIPGAGSPPLAAVDGGQDVPVKVSVPQVWDGSRRYG